MALSHLMDFYILLSKHLCQISVCFLVQGFYFLVVAQTFDYCPHTLRMISFMLGHLSLNMIVRKTEIDMNLSEHLQNFFLVSETKIGERSLLWHYTTLRSLKGLLIYFK